MSLPLGAPQTGSRPCRRIGRYVVTGRLGRGGMGMVYRGWDEQLEREVAIKTLTLEGQLDEESRRRFEIEAKAAARLQHPNILTVFELGEDRGVPFIAMELLPGVDLETLLRSGQPLPLAERLEIVIQVCRGLAFAHERSIVHRDVKPSNVRVLDDGSAKIMDFGIAKLQGTGVTKAGMLVGTVHYMSPEQVRGRALDGRSDLFSVGVILHELLTGRRPFGGASATEVLYKIVHDPCPPLAPGPDLDPRLAAIVERTLAKEPEARWASADALADALSDALAALRQESGAAALPPAAADAVHAARRLLKDGRPDEAAARLRPLVAQHADAVDAHRLLRAAERQIASRLQPAPPADDDYPELDATLQSPPTARTPGTATLLRPTERRVEARTEVGPAAPAARAAASSRAWLLGGAALAGLLALGAALALLRGGAAIPAPAVQRVPVRSQPPGAEVLLDGQPTGAVTDAELSLPATRQGRVTLTLRKAGYQDESRSLTLPLRAEEAVSVTLDAVPAALGVETEPPGATVTLDGLRVAGTTPLRVSVDPATEHRLGVSLEGYQPQDVRLERGRPPGELKLALQPAGPAGSLRVVSSYPLDVVWKGRTLAHGQASPQVRLPQGRQSVTLLAPQVFLRATVGLDVGAESSLQAPPLGRINVKAVPDNCEVFVDGVSAGYLPILDRPIAVGTHAVVFRWPDGRRAEEVVELDASRPGYVVGRKE